jgi:ribosomal protein S12 methylthiotransferase
LGAVELVLIAQDTAAYRDPETDTGLGELLRKLDKVNGISWLRVMYAHPAHVEKGLLAAFMDVGKLVPYLDMPIQHASDKVLKAMGRGYSAESLKRTIEGLRKACPDIALRTTVMVGHPGEDKQAFSELLKFIEETKFVNLGAFVFRPEEGTISAGLEPACSAEEAEERLDAVMALQQGMTFGFLDSYKGKVTEILPETPYEARTAFQAPEVDGIVLSDYPWLVGGISRALITSRQDYDLKGEPL